jgi:ubiquinone/menaquinone biosynthesis C-methylase UbiE
MKIYERGNASKQGIFLELQARALQRPLRILDLACGDGRLWSVFLPMHPHVSVVGIDTDASAIQRGQARQQERLELRVFDAQHPLKDELFDVVVAFSAIEHVVDRSAFLRTVWGALASKALGDLKSKLPEFNIDPKAPLQYSKTGEESAMDITKFPEQATYEGFESKVSAPNQTLPENYEQLTNGQAAQ